MKDRGQDGDHGFSLIELIVVVGIIFVLAAMAMPAIGRYFRNYQIREAQSQIAAAIQSARAKAIAKNVNHGVSFVVESPTRFWVHVEDDQSAAHSRDQELLDFEGPEQGQSTFGDLPSGVRFAQNGECPHSTAVGGGAYAPNGYWFRFNRLGGWCGGAACGAPPAPDNGVALMNNASNTLVCVFQPTTGLSRALLVDAGGRVRTAN